MKSVIKRTIQRCNNIIIHIISFLFLLYITPANSSEIIYRSVDNLDVYYLEGQIEFSDISKFEQLLNSTRNPNKRSLLFLNSPGGNLNAAYFLGAQVFKANITTIVANSHICLSACFAVLISGNTRFADLESTVGVHRASLNYHDNVISKGSSVDMNEFYRSMKVPPNIRLAMMETPPSEMYILTIEDKINISNMKASNYNQQSNFSSSNEYHSSSNSASDNSNNTNSYITPRISKDFYLEVDDMYGKDEIVGEFSIKKDNNISSTNLSMIINRQDNLGNNLWTVRDFVNDCVSPAIPNLEMVTPVHTTDLDNNGIDEVWMMYKLSCRTEFIPAVLKIIMYEGKTKYAVRGRTYVDGCHDQCGNFKMDNNMENANKVIKDYAVKLWKSNMKE